MRLERNVRTAMADGIELVSDIFLPDGEKPFPVILIRTPYDRLKARIRRKGWYFSSHGFAVVIQDVRGTGESPGHDTFVPWYADGEDGRDTLLWLERQSFCNGKIGTHGGSYLATNQWLTAPLAPESLKCMVAYVGPYSFRSGYYHGGAHYLMITLPYALMMDGVIDFAAGGPDALEQMHKRLWTLPLVDADLAGGGHNTMFHDMITKSFSDPYWNRMDGFRDASAIHVPTLQMEGWFDAYSMQAFRARDILKGGAGTDDARNQARILVGAWGHDRSGESFGDMNFGANVNTDLYQYELTWFQHWLMGIDTPIVHQPPVRVFTMGLNTWRDFSEWPPSDAHESSWYLHSLGGANSLSGDGRLSRELPGDESADRFEYDPLDPVPSVGGNHSVDFAGIPAGPFDQREIEARRDVLVYTSEVLECAVEMSGPVALDLWAVSSAPDTDFTAKVVDVFPGGDAFNLCEGIIRAGFRNGGDHSEPIEPGKPYCYRIQLFDTSHCFLPGHRIRVDVSSSNFPRFSRNLNTGANSHTTAETAIASQTILHDDTHPSALLVFERDC